MAYGYMWVKTKPKKIELSNRQKNAIAEKCNLLIEILKKDLIADNPDKRNNYLADIYIKWRQNYLYFCAKYKAEYPERIAGEFEEKFVRLEFLEIDECNFSYMRNTGQWELINSGMKLSDCLEMIKDIPTFQPI